jgi:hypothetical protein
MAELAKKKATAHFVVLSNAPSACVADSRKSKHFRVSIALNLISTTERVIMRILQDSSYISGLCGALWGVRSELRELGIASPAKRLASLVSISCK